MTPSNEKAAGGGAVETVAWLCEPIPEGWGYRSEMPDWQLAATAKYVAENPNNPYWKPTESLVRRTDAESALKLQADRIAELEGALDVARRVLVAVTDEEWVPVNSSIAGATGVAVDAIDAALSKTA